jgi:hypothetical protein
MLSAKGQDLQKSEQHGCLAVISDVLAMLDIIFSKRQQPLDRFPIIAVLLTLDDDLQKNSRKYRDHA